MIVIDASVLVAFLVASDDGARRAAQVIASESALAAPTLISYEVGHAVRRQFLQGLMTAERAALAMDTLQMLRLDLFAAAALMPRAWQLRTNFSFYDACYVALAERLDCPLYTFDAKLARAPGHLAKILRP